MGTSLLVAVFCDLTSKLVRLKGLTSKLVAAKMPTSSLVALLDTHANEGIQIEASYWLSSKSSSQQNINPIKPGDVSLQ